MNILELIKQLNDMKLLYGNKIILKITDGKSDYIIRDITGMSCAKYFVPSDRVAEVIINIKREDTQNE